MRKEHSHTYLPRVPLSGKRVLVAMSGGVDSSVAAALLKKAGAEVVGATFKNFCFKDNAALPEKSCCSVDAVADALKVCRHLGVEHKMVDETERFGAEVIDNFHAEYRAGRTPNPCSRCNAAVRFPRLVEEALAGGFDYVATGHYARIVAEEEHHFLAAGKDGAKDQSYFLAGMDPALYERILFPLGEFTKDVTRRLAGEAGLHVTEKRESQDICFLAGRSLKDYLDEQSLLRPGSVLNAAGEKLGEHPGAELYTVGQRHGLGVAGGRPLYVTRVDAERGEVTLDEESGLYAGAVRCGSAWLHPALPASPEASELGAKIRYRSPSRPLDAVEFAGDILTVEFSAPVKAVAPGQSLVIYRGDRVMGCGVIESAS